MALAYHRLYQAANLDVELPQAQTYRVLNGRNLDLHQVKELNLVIESKNVADHVTNRKRGSFKLQSILFVPDRAEVEPADDAALLDLLERRSCQYFLDWASRKQDGWQDAQGTVHTGSFGMPQDRSTFGDLLTVGGVGFALPAYITCAERGWIPRSDASQRTLAVLRLMANSQVFGPDRVGRIGYRGWLYHFLGLDGRRKLNFDFPSTPRDESLNTVEVSTIDTGLALMGVLTAQSYFDQQSTDETEIRTLAQEIYDRVE